MSETKTRRGYIRELSSRLGDGVDDFARAWKTQAKRQDRVGDLSYRGLELVHGGLGVAVRSLSHLEKVTQLPARPAKPQPHVAETPVKPAPAHHGRSERHEPEPTGS